MMKFYAYFVFALFLFTSDSFATVSPSIASPVSLGTAVSFSCDTGDTLSWFDSTDTFLASSDCSGTVLSLLSDTYSFVECDSTAVLADCTETSLVSLIADTGYISDISFEWSPDPFSTMSDETQSIYTFTTFGLAKFLIFLITTFGLIGIGIRGMRSLR